MYTVAGNGNIFFSEGRVPIEFFSSPMNHSNAEARKEDMDPTLSITAFIYRCYAKQHLSIVHFNRVLRHTLTFWSKVEYLFRTSLIFTYSKRLTPVHLQISLFWTRILPWMNKVSTCWNALLRNSLPLQKTSFIFQLTAGRRHPLSFSSPQEEDILYLPAHRRKKTSFIFQLT